MTAIPMNCQEIESQLPLYVGEELEASARETVRVHLEVCDACSRQMDGLARARRLVQQHAEPTREVDLWPGIRAALVEEGRLSAAPGATAGAGRSWAWRLVPAAALAAAAAILIMTRPQTPTPGRDIAPERSAELPLAEVSPAAFEAAPRSSGLRALPAGEASMADTVGGYVPVRIKPLRPAPTTHPLETLAGYR